MPVAVLSTDNYFNDISLLINKYGSFDNLRDNGYDVDAPTSFQLDILKSDLEDLSDGLDIKAPMYLPNGTGVSVPKAFDVHSQKSLLLKVLQQCMKKLKMFLILKFMWKLKTNLEKAVL